MSEANSPLLADHLYGVRRRIERAPELKTLGYELGLKRQALHAAHLGFEHPTTGEWLSFDSPLPPDLMAPLNHLRSYYHAPVLEER